MINYFGTYCDINRNFLNLTKHLMSKRIILSLKFIKTYHLYSKSFDKITQSLYLIK
jgi:hypothetical protein